MTASDTPDMLTCHQPNKKPIPFLKKSKLFYIFCQLFFERGNAVRLILIANIANARIWLMSWNSQVGRPAAAGPSAPQRFLASSKHFAGHVGETALPS